MRSDVKKIQCMELHGSRNHPLAQERRRADYYQSMYDMIK